MGPRAPAYAPRFTGVLPPSKERSPGEGSQAHSEGSIALHRCHGRQKLDLRERREGAKGGIEGVVSLGPIFIALVDALRAALGPPISHRQLKRPRGIGQASLQS
jgi:hypothetical protein